MIKYSYCDESAYVYFKRKSNKSKEYIRIELDASRSENLIPDYWKAFINDNRLAGKLCEIPERADLSELSGGRLKFLTESEIYEESDEFYPGIAVKKFGYLPVAGCWLGSGHPYFINVNDGPNGNFYRIYHDAEMLDDDTYDMVEAVNIVLREYNELLKYLI